MLREPVLVDCGGYVVAQGRDLEDGSIATSPLFIDESIADTLAELRAMLVRDEEVKSAGGVPTSGPIVAGLEAFAGQWFQRIDFPEYNLWSVMDRRWVILGRSGCICDR